MKQKKTFTAYFMVHGAVIAAIYVVLTILFAPISFGPVQFRISEALCVLPYFTPAAVPGVFLGCLLSNLLCGAAALDVVFGSLATLILSNTIIIPWVLRYAYGSEDMILFAMVTVGIGEVLAIGVLGNGLRAVLEHYRYILFDRKANFMEK